jgi:UrcA family protein
MKPILMLAAAAVSMSLLLPTVSHAQMPEDYRVLSEVVEISDLNLSTAEGQARLERRINMSIRRVCSEDGLRGLEAAAAFKDCVKAAKQESNRQVQLALAVHKARDKA